MGTDITYWGTQLRQPKEILEMKDIHKGKRAFIIGNGPSLKEEETETLETLAHELTFTCNRLPLWEECPFLPDYHAFSEPDVIQESKWGECEWFNDIVGPEQLPHFAIHWQETQIPGWQWIAKAPDNYQVRHEGVGFWGLTDELAPIPTGWCTPLTFAQLAAWMGVREFYFLGIDTTPQGEVFNATEHRTGVHPRKIRGIKECFARARVDIEKAGGKIYDCTKNGIINHDEILPFVELKDALGVKA